MGVLDSRPPWISATLWTWGRWPRTSRWICLSTSSGKEFTLNIITNFFSLFARYDTRVEPNEKFLHGRDAKGRYLTLTSKYADMVKIIIMTMTMVVTMMTMIMMVRKIMAVILMITIMTSLPALDPWRLHRELEGHAGPERYQLFRETNLDVSSKPQIPRQVTQLSVGF